MPQLLKTIFMVLKPMLNFIRAIFQISVILPLQISFINSQLKKDEIHVWKHVEFGFKTIKIRINYLLSTVNLVQFI